MKLKSSKLINIIWDCFGKKIYLILDRMKTFLHFRQIPPANRGIGTNIEKNLPKRDIKMFPNVVLIKNRISW